MSRPELQNPPELYYNEAEAEKYTHNSRIRRIQRVLSERAVELLMLPSDRKCMLLDIGCGSGLSGDVISEAGHFWMGTDVSRHMLNVAVERGSDGDVHEHDMGQGLPFRPGVFDGAISISAVQWLCYAHTKAHVPSYVGPWRHRAPCPSAHRVSRHSHRLLRFFQSLYTCLRRGARAVLQLYPETPAQMEMITRAAMSCGFSGGLVVDYPNSTKAKKCYLVCMAGQDSGFAVPRALGTDGVEAGGGAGAGGGAAIAFEGSRVKARRDRRSERVNVKDRDWILRKKERQRKQGREVKRDSKYSGRRRPTPLT